MPPRKHDHYLKGLLHCGECGRHLSLTLAKGKYLYLYCLGQSGPTRTGCRQPYILAGEELEAEIVDRQAEAADHRVVLTKKLAKLADEHNKLLQAFYANAIPR